MMKKKNLLKTIKNVLIDNLRKVYCISLLCCYSCESKEKTIPTENNPPKPYEFDEKFLTIVDELKNIKGKDFYQLLDEYIEKHPEDKDYCGENKESIEFMFNLQNPHSPSPQTPPPPPQPVPQKNEKKNKEIVDELKDKELEDKMEKYKEPQPTEQKNFVDDNKEEIRKEYKKQQEKKKNLCPNCKKDPCECEKEKKYSKEKELNDLVNSIDNEYKARDYVKSVYVDNLKFDIDEKIKEVKKFIDGYIYTRPIQEVSKKLNAQNVDHLEFDINELNTVAKKIKEQNPSLDEKQILEKLKYSNYENSFLLGYDDGSYPSKFGSYQEYYDAIFNSFVDQLDYMISNEVHSNKKLVKLNPNLFENFKKEDVAKKIMKSIEKHRCFYFSGSYDDNGLCMYNFYSNDGHNWFEAHEIPNDFLLGKRQFDLIPQSNVIYDRISKSYYSIDLYHKYEWLKNFWNKVKWNDEQGCFETNS